MYSTVFPADWCSTHAQTNKCNAEHEHKTISLLGLALMTEEKRETIYIL